MCNLIYKTNTNEFHLTNGNLSYILKVLDNGNLGHIYFGKPIKINDSYVNLYRKGRHLTVESEDGVPAGGIKPDFMCEYAQYGTGDYTEGAFQLKQPNGSIVTDFKYMSHEIVKGKPKLMSGKMPATYGNDCQTLVITLVDKLIDVRLVLYYTIFEKYNIITRSAKFINGNADDMKLTRALSASIDFDSADFELLQLDGSWLRERHINISKLRYGSQRVGSSRGASSAIHNPFIALQTPGTTEYSGEIYGFNLVYSGNFTADVEVTPHDLTRVLFGINPYGFEWNLRKGEEFQTPELVMAYSQNGVTEMSQHFHNLYLNNLIRGDWQYKVPPTLINNWEATYFDFTEEKILDIAKAAKEIDIELFVLDDGWFGKRDKDDSSLGDWFPDTAKLPDGIIGLSKKINSIGLKFGLWFEPEMVCPVSKLHEEHPDWVISIPGRHRTLQRTQSVLDFSKKEVVDNIYEQMKKVIDGSAIEYIKWDMNRNITEPMSAFLDADSQGELMHRYILGVYDLYDRLTNEFPNILFESCASGGGRYDPGMLYYAPQTWASDDSDAMERLKIQYGTSLAYPIKSIGAHVSASPNHQVLRNTSINTRANVAYFGTFGYELDATKLSDEDKAMIKKQIKYFKDHAELIHFGDFYRLQSPFIGDGNDVAWMSVSKDKSKAFLGAYQVLGRPNPVYKRLKLKGLDKDAQYKISGVKGVFYGSDLMDVGFYNKVDFGGNNWDIYAPVREENAFEGILGAGDFSSKVFVIEKIK